jgi:DNA-binding NarL/FixJ family response regulator
MIGHENGSQRLADDELLDAGGERLRVLIVDHDGFARRMMRAALGEISQVAILLTAGDGREALELARYYHPTVVIIDTALPPDGGVELIAKVLAVAPGARVLTVSVDDSQAAIAGLRAGAVGHIGKDIEPDELARLVVRAADGEAIVPQRLIKPLLELVREVPDAGWRPLHSRLTSREWEIVELLGEGATTHQIAERLVLSPTTIYSHVKSMLRKLGVHSRHEAIAAARALRKQEATRTRRGEISSIDSRPTPHRPPHIPAKLTPNEARSETSVLQNT